MTRSADITAINCTSCGAGLDVLGGGRVITHVCGYCGSVLDAQHNYKVLKKFAEMPRPASPFRIGMKGLIQGIEFTIIGTLGKREDYGGKTWFWTDHQLFSPTHGYAWLTVEDGHFVFTRKMRQQPRPSWISSRTVERSEYRPTAYFKDELYKYFSTTTGKTTFVEGEFNWLPELGDTTTAVALMSDDAMVRFVDGKQEREVERSVYLPCDETCAAFGVTDHSAPFGIHALQPYSKPAKGSNRAFTSKVLKFFTVASLLISIVFWMMPGTNLLDEQGIEINALPAVYDVKVDHPNSLMRVSLNSNVSNDWAIYTLTLIDPEGETVFDTFRQISYYTGRDSEGTWSEGSRSTNIRFRPSKTGLYKLNINREEGTGGSYVSVRVASNVPTGLWTFIMTILFAIGAFLTHGQNGRTKHFYKRWAKSDWDED